jgi:G3E family GTPase
MATPVYVVTGFLDAGKTTFLNSLLNRSDWRDVKILLVQFETGEEEFESRHHNCDSITVPKKVLEKQPKQIVDRLHSYIQNEAPDEIWIEWNGVVPFSQLQSLLLNPPLRGLCKIRKVIHIADAANIENLLGRTGGALPEQIAGCDFVVVRNLRSRAVYKRLRRLVRGMNPGVKVYELKAFDDLYKTSSSGKRRTLSTCFVLAVVFDRCPAPCCRTALEMLHIPVKNRHDYIPGIILQASSRFY